jgi:hypothetical protein
MLLQMLVRHRGLKASDERDKVYALLGVYQKLNPQKALPMLVDYSKDVEEVNLDAATACIAMARHLGILGHALFKEESQLLGYSSWVPWWATDKTVAGLEYLLNRHWTAPSPAADPRNQLFRVDGRLLITQVLIIKPLARADEVIESQAISCFSRLVGLWTACVANLSAASVVEKTSEIRTSVTKLAKAWLGGWNLPTWRYIESLDRVDVNATARVYGELLGAVDLALALFHAFCPTVTPRDVATALGYLDYFRRPAIDEERHGFFDLAYSRRFVWLDGGAAERGFDYGLGPPYARAGDVVAILFDASTPFVLWPCDHGQGWLLVGACYLEGIMQGELCEKSADGKMPADQYEQLEFIIH